MQLITIFMWDLQKPRTLNNAERDKIYRSRGDWEPHITWLKIKVSDFLVLS